MIINGVIATSQSIGTTLFTYIGEQMINPNGVQSDPIVHLYKAEISKNIKKFLLLQIFCVLGSFIICEMLTKTYDEKNKEKFSIKFLFRVNEIKILCNKKKDEKKLLIQTLDDVFSINPEIKEEKIDKNKKS